MPQTVKRQFPEEGKAAVHGVRRAFIEVLSSVGGNPDEPQEIARRFGLDKTLTWRIARVVREEDAWEAVTHIPRKPSIVIFNKAMTKFGAPRDRIEALTKAMNEFDEFVEVHSGDRETLEAMVSGSPSRSAEKRMEVFRRSGFQASAAIWGVRARLQASLSILVPGPTPGTLDSATIGGFADLFRLRTNVPWAVASAVAWDARGHSAPEMLTRPIPLNPGGLIEGTPLLPDFCSSPLPTVRHVDGSSGSDSGRFELTDGPVGNTAASTVFVGWKWPAPLSMYETCPGEPGEHGMHLSTPVEMSVLDLLVHRSLDFIKSPTARLYSELPGGPRYHTEGQTIGRMPVPEVVVDLGAGPPDVTLPEMPRYRELAEFATGRLGHAISEFQGYRFRVRYPPIPTLALLQHRLLPR